ncbi:translocation protein SEC63 homolog [Liolophura sinensis]|uniref:translocation protein SEC63 homolog n=1 Tax=Liolophura sinensis TaxID=3198878 RepID=UPI00315922F4
MAGMQFEYDEEGGTFFYFLLSFWGLVLIPATYYLWPRKVKKEAEEKQIICQCGPCIEKNHRLKANQPWIQAKQKGIKVGLAIGWVIFALLAYKVSKIQLDYVEYDPFVELGIERGASTSEIRRAYRQLSLVLHPDKSTGDSAKFMRVAKAYAALTDEDSRKNWEEYGNPDGPGVTRFGIALPKWIVERENSVWVLGVYAAIFLIILPLAVGTWWYRSIKFTGDQVLLDTTKLYCYFFHKTPNMILKRAIMVLAASWEFDKFHNKDIVERPSDNEEIPMLMRDLPNLNEKNKEKPLCFPYSVKARALIHSHLTRLKLPPNSLELDRQYVLEKCPYLINEMINCVAQLVAGAATGRLAHMPRLETAENCMKLSQMIIQGLEDKSSPLLQLPHITQDMLKHFCTRRRTIRSIREFVAMKSEDRRSLLRTLSDSEYQDVINVASDMPNVEMTVRSEVLDDEDSTITAGSIVTVTVTLKRQSMSELFDKEHIEPEQPVEEDVKMDEVEEDTNQAGESPLRKPKVWEKQKKQKKKGGHGKQKKKVKQVYNWKAAAGVGIAKQGQESHKDPNGTVPSEDQPVTEKGEDSEEEMSAAEESENSGAEDQNPDNDHEPADDDEDWSQYQEEAKKETVLETKAKESHPVHCPYFPIEKQEAWWVYVADRKAHMLITAPVQLCSLKREEEVKLKFSAPPRPGIYHYSVIMRSDSYLDFDQMQNIKLDVKEAKIVEDHPQWELSDDEEKEQEEESEDSDYSTEEEDSE